MTSGPVFRPRTWAIAARQPRPRRGRTWASAGVLPPGSIVNQWSATFSQPASFGTTPPALQSVPVALTPANGTGWPTPGNWLFCLVGMNEPSAAAGATVAVGDDIRSFWRPGDETASNWAVSTSSALTRTAIWYTPNTVRQAGYVYVAPSGVFDALSVLVVEVAGLGPWDTVTSLAVNYSAGATTLNLALGAPSSAAFTIAAVAGDSATAGQAFTPSGWTRLRTVQATNGSDHTSDCVLTAASLPVTTGSISVNGTASSATDLSGVILQVLQNAPSPIPAGQNPNWPFLKFEMASGGGFQTPPDQLTWTDLTNRLWGWNETTGIQYQLGQIQATELELELDNFDGALASDQVAAAGPWTFTASGTPATGSYFIVTTAQSANIAAQDGFTDKNNPGTLFTVTSLSDPFAGFVNVSFTPAAASVMSSPDVVTQVNPAAGTPLRIRAALGTIGGQAVNRWYVIQRNAEQWAQQIDPDYRRRIAATGTDIWSVLSSSGPTPYRGEIQQDNPYAWWPMDDQPLSGGVQPTTLRNAATGNSNTLAITPAPGGVSAADAYSTTGTDLTATGTNSITPPLPSVAVYAAGQQAGWMYGDPQSSPQSYATSNPVTANPGSAAWQQTGFLGNTGAPGWFLIVNDANLPPLSGGVTIEGWFNCGFAGSATGYLSPSNTRYQVAGQPVTTITIATLSTNTAPVVELQLDTSGHLNLVTFNGTTPTSHAVYSTSDLRSAAWVSVNIVLTQTTWACYVNGGLTASASGSVSSMTSAWTWLTLGGDYGNTSGGSAPANLVHGSNIAFSHWSVYTGQLPAWRILAHYCAAITGFGLIPAPQGLSLSAVANKLAGQGYTPDGSEFQGSYGQSGASIFSYTFSAVAVAQAGSFTSGPSARAASAGYGTDSGGIFYGDAVWVSWSSLSPSVAVYNASAANAETNAATVAGSGDSFTTGYGSGATGGGVCQTAAGSGASPPASASALGDTVQQRLERILGYGNTTYPGRCVDPASLAVQAATDIGGQQTGQNLTNIAQSDGGLLAVDNLGNLTYWQKSHLAAQYSAPAWTLTPAAPPTPGAAATAIPYYRDLNWTADPQKVFNAILIQPFSPDGSSLADITPSQASQVNTSQLQYGAQPRPVTSYLQSTTEMQNQANWIFSNFGQANIRVEGIRIDAAPYPAAFPLVLGINVGDVVTCQNWQIGGGGATGTFRVTRIRRMLSFGGDDPEDDPRAEVTLDLDPEPSSYWT